MLKKFISKIKGETRPAILAGAVAEALQTIDDNQDSGSSSPSDAGQSIQSPVDFLLQAAGFEIIEPGHTYALNGIKDISLDEAMKIYIYGPLRLPIPDPHVPAGVRTLLPPCGSASNPAESGKYNPGSYYFYGGSKDASDIDSHFVHVNEDLTAFLQSNENIQVLSFGSLEIFPMSVDNFALGAKNLRKIIGTINCSQLSQYSVETKEDLSSPSFITKQPLNKINWWSSLTNLQDFRIKGIQHCAEYKLSGSGREYIDIIDLSMMPDLSLESLKFMIENFKPRYYTYFYVNQNLFDKISDPANSGIIPEITNGTISVS